MNRSSVRTVASGGGISLVGRFAGRGLALSSQIVLARSLGPASYGLYSLGLATLKVVGLLAQVGMDRGVIRMGSKYLGKDETTLRDILKQGVLIPLGIGTSVGLFTFMWAPRIAMSAFGHPQLAAVLRAFAPGFGLYAGLRVTAAATTLTKDMRYMVKAQELVQPGLELTLLATVHLLGWGLLGAVGATVCSLAVGLFVALIDLSRIFPLRIGEAFSFESLRLDLISYSISLGGVSLIQVLLQWVDRYLLGLFRTAVEVGIYQAAAQAAVLFTIILSSLNAVFLPILSDLSEQGRMSELEELYRVITKWGLYLSLPAYIVFLFLPNDLLALVYGEAYRRGVHALLILATGSILNLSTGAVGLLLIMNDKVWQWTTIAATMLATNILLGVLLIPRFGMTGAAVATTVAVVGQFWAGLALVRRDLGIWPYDSRYLKGLTAVAAAGILVILVVRFVDSSPLVRLLTSGLISFSSFILALRFLGLDDEDRELLETVASHISRIGR